MHKFKKLVIKKQPKKLKKQKSTQKPFDPLSYTVRRSSGKKSTTSGMSRAMSKLSERHAIPLSASRAATSTDEVVIDHGADKDNRQPVSYRADGVPSNTEVPIVHDVEPSAEEGSVIVDTGNDDPPASCRSDRKVEQTTHRRSQNKSPPRSARSDSIPKKIRSPDLPVVQVGLISLFDGIGSVLPTLISRLQAYPKVFIAAECEEELRQLVAAQTGLNRNGKWTKLDGGTFGMYIDDVRKLLFNDCFKLISRMLARWEVFSVLLVRKVFFSWLRSISSGGL